MDPGPLVDAAVRAGVRDWRLHLNEGRRLTLGIKDRQAGNPHVPLKIAGSGGVRYLWIWDDGRVSSGVLERSRLETDPRGAVDEARAAAYDDPDAAWVPGPADFPDPVLHDARAAAIAGGDVALVAERLDAVRARFDGARARTWSGSFSASEGRARVLTSAGLDVGGEGTTWGWHVSVDGEAADGFAARAPESDDAYGARLARLDATARELRRDAPPGPGGIQPVLLHPRVVEDYVVDTLFANLEGAAVAHGESAFALARFGDASPVFREDLGLAADPLQPLAAGSYRFTGEGLPAAPCTFVRAGRLVTPVLDLKYARRLGLAPTPAPQAADGIRLTGPGPIGLDEARARAEGGVLVLSVLGVHTQDATSGDFSLSAPQALRISGAGFTGRLRATLSGNVFELLRSDALMLVRFEGEPLPGLLVSCRLDPR